MPKITEKICSQYDTENIQDIIYAKNNGLIFSIGRASRSL